MKFLLLSCSFFLLIGCTNDETTTETLPPAAEEVPLQLLVLPQSETEVAELPGRWSKERIATYVAERPWQVGANYNNRDAINQLEMFQAATFKPEQIDEELGWAAGIGMNATRVYLHNLLWEQDSAAFLRRLETYLDVAAGHGITTTFVLFDGVWNPVSELGEQPAPRPHVHNSGWVQSPPERQLTLDGRYDAQLKSYAQGVIRHFANDERVYAWDLYNEPDNQNFGKFPAEKQADKEARAFSLLRKVFPWAREVNPSQPLTAGVWFGPMKEEEGSSRFTRFQLNNSDLISFHCYGDAEMVTDNYLFLAERYGRPLLCTEYMARTNGSTFQAILPLFAEHNIGAINWGLVSGKTQTIYPWHSWEETFTAEPETWFHDVFHPDGTPYDTEETKLIKALTTAAAD